LEHGARKIRVLVADDSRTALRAVCAYLDFEERFEIVGTASDGLRLRDKAESLQPDLVLTDLSMPQLTGLEAAEQFDWNLPDVIFYPTGGGVGLIGMWKAFAELEQLGWIGSKRPKMIAVQAEGCPPIVQAFERNAEFSEFWHGAATLASGLRVPKAMGDFLVLQAVRESGGTAVSVSDSQMMKAAEELAAREGLFIAPEGGACMAALKKLSQSGFLNKRDRILIYNTGSGYKYLETWAGYYGSSSSTH